MVADFDKDEILKDDPARQVMWDQVVDEVPEEAMNQLMKDAFIDQLENIYEAKHDPNAPDLAEVFAEMGYIQGGGQELPE